MTTRSATRVAPLLFALLASDRYLLANGCNAVQSTLQNFLASNHSPLANYMDDLFHHSLTYSDRCSPYQTSDSNSLAKPLGGCAHWEFRMFSYHFAIARQVWMLSSVTSEAETLEPLRKWRSSGSGVIHISGLPILAILVLWSQSVARADILTFEGLPDGTSVTTQYWGLTFTNATVITAGISLNEFEFPPHSGRNVVFDDGGPISIAFASPALSFSGFFTYLEPLTLAAFDSGGTQVDSAVSAFSSNLALSGDPGSGPNEFLSVAFAIGISTVSVTGASGGDSFVMDDAVVISAVPEPPSAFLLFVVIFIIICGHKSWQCHV